MALRFGFISAVAVQFFAFLSLILVIFQLEGTSFLLSLLLTIGCLALSAVGLGAIMAARKWGWTLLALLSLIFLIYGYVVYMNRGIIDMLHTLASASLILLVLSVVNLNLEEPRRRRRLGKVEVYGQPEKVEPKAESKKTTYTPGKFVASKFASTYHVPKCEWANNIKESNQVWFQTTDEAKKAKYRAHGCIQ